MKITEATDEQKIRELVELDGMSLAPCPCGKDGCFLPPKKDYLTSYDAIIPLIQKQDEQTVRKIVSHLAGWTNTTSVQCWKIFEKLQSLTPERLSDALLVATGKFTL